MQRVSCRLELAAIACMHAWSREGDLVACNEMQQLLPSNPSGRDKTNSHNSLGFRAAHAETHSSACAHMQILLTRDVSMWYVCFSTIGITVYT